MCGIAGIIGNVSIDKLNIMNQVQHMRGPDSSGHIVGTNYGFAHNRLSIIDLSESGNQPMQIGDWILTYNGEIYNYKELKSQLIEEGVEFYGTSDTEVLLNLIMHHGINETLKLINGIFAFCAYNIGTGDYYLVRDRLGLKPLFYYIDENNGDTLYFASNPSAIVKCLPEVDWQLDKIALWEYFAMGGIFTNRTLFKGINRLDSGSVMSSIGTSKYWTPKYHTRVTNDDMKNKIRSAIVSRTIADVPMTMFLSGGVDSSTIAAVIKDLDAVHLISKEVDNAREVAEIFDMNFTVVEPQQFDISEVLSEYANFSGEPTMSGFIPYIISKEISSTYKVAISANGADELFFGYNRIPTPNIPNLFFEKRMEILNTNINKPSMSPDEHVSNIFRSEDSFSIPILNDVFKPKISNLINSELESFDESFPKSSRYRWIELMTYIKGDLNNTLDFASMRNSLEVRCPFLDYELVELALSIDDVNHISSKNGRKHYLKEILHEEGVPSHIWERTKIGFSLIADYLDSIESLKDNAVNNLKEEGYLSINHGSGRDFSYLRSAALGFYHWKKEWIDSELVKK